jgi:replicative DNA helicase
VMDEVMFLEDEDFSDPVSQMLWKCIKYLYENERPIELNSIVALLEQAGKLDQVGGVLGINDFVETAVTANNAGYYAQQVRKAATLRRIQQKALEIYNDARYSTLDSVDELVSKLDEMVESVRPDETKGLRHVSEIEESLFERLDQKKGGIKTGIYQFDKWSNGLRRKDLVIVAGRPSIGKTAYMLQLAVGMAKQNEGAVLIWSQEMEYEDLMLRALSAETSVPFRFLMVEKDQLTPEFRQKLRDKYRDLCKLPIYVDDAAGKSIEEIKAAVKQFKRRKGPVAAVFVDYLQIMNIPQKSGETRAQAIGRVTQAAKKLAKDENLVFVMLSQLNRDTDKEEVPTMGHLKESGAIEQDADIINFLYTHPNDKDEPTQYGCRWVRSWIAKGRNYGTVQFKCSFMGWCQKYEFKRVVEPGEDAKKKEKRKG